MRPDEALGARRKRGPCQRSRVAVKVPNPASDDCRLMVAVAPAD